MYIQQASQHSAASSQIYPVLLAHSWMSLDETLLACIMLSVRTCRSCACCHELILVALQACDLMFLLLKHNIYITHMHVCRPLIQQQTACQIACQTPCLKGASDMIVEYVALFLFFLNLTPLTTLSATGGSDNNQRCCSASKPSQHFTLSIKRENVDL